MHPLVNIGTKAARDGGRILMRAFDERLPLEIESKGQHDFVTQIDKAVEKTIIYHIQKAYPQHGIESEECGIVPGDEDYTWIIDPLDGTTNFIHGLPQFCISIAIKIRDRIEHGIVYDPVRDELFVASRGHGARLNNRRMRVSETKSLNTALLGTGFPFKDTPIVAPYTATLQNLFTQTVGIRRAGAAALDLAYIAAGRLDGFWEYGLKDWDFAAAALMVQEAGGCITTFDGDRELLGKKTILASNLSLHGALQGIIEPEFKGFIR